MKAQELRLGNYVLCEWIEEEWNHAEDNYVEAAKSKYGKVVRLDSDESSDYAISVECRSDEGNNIEEFESIEPILLTEQW